MRALICGGVMLAALAGCDHRGGRHVVLLPDEVAGRQDAQWRVAQEPAATGPAVARDQTDPPAAP